MPSFQELREKALRNQQKAMAELEAAAAENARRLAEARRANREAQSALRAARSAVRNASANVAAAAPKSVKTRKRRPGANAEIAGDPEHLRPGAPLRRVEGKTAHPQTLALTRGKRTKAKRQG